MRLRLLSSIVAALSVLSIAPSVCSAQGAAASPEQKVLDQFVGKWDETYEVAKTDFTPEARKGTAKVDYRSVLGGKFVQQDAEHSDGASAMLMYTYDEQESQYRGWWFSSMGLTSEYEGEWDADSKTMTWRTVEGSPVASTIVKKFVDGDHIEWEVTVKGDGDQLYFSMKGKSVRVK